MPSQTDTIDTNLPRQPEEEPHRRISTTLEEDASRLREAQNVPVPESPSSAEPAVDLQSDQEAPSTLSFSSDQSHTEPNDGLEPVYNVQIFENSTGQDVVLEDQDSVWEKSESVQSACVSFAFDIPPQQLNKFLKRPEDHLPCLIAAAKKSRNELVYSDLNVEEQELFKAAKQKELKCWLDTNTVKSILRDRIHPSRIMSSRWILTWKEDASSPNGRKAKARLQ